MERKQHFDQFSVDVAINYRAKLAYKIVGWLGCRKSVLTQNTVKFTINKFKLFSKAAHRVLNLVQSYTKLRWLQSCTKKRSVRPRVSSASELLGYLGNLVPRASLLPVNDRDLNQKTQAFYQLFHLILHEIDRFGCFMLKSGFFSKSLVLCLTHSLLEILPKNAFWS